MKLTVAHDFLPKTPTLRTSAVMDHFGIDFERGRHVVAEGLELDLKPEQVVAFTGPSGSGKSSLMRAAAELLPGRVVNVDEVELPDRPLVDALPGTVEEAMRLLSRCGLGEAHLMLRTPAELSEGQRYRFRLAAALAACGPVSPTPDPGDGSGEEDMERLDDDSTRSSEDFVPQPPAGRCRGGRRGPGSETPDHTAWIVADEFTATLDRTLARVIAAGARKWGVGVIVATTHEDVVADLDPDVWVRCELGEPPRVIDSGSPAADDADFEDRRCRRVSRSLPAALRGETPGESPTKPSCGAASSGGDAPGVGPLVKKNSPKSSGSARAPRPTGRTSLGGITAATRSGCCGS